MITKRNILKIAVVLVTVLVLFLFNHYQKIKLKAGPIETTLELGEMIIHIDGEVNEPGVYQLPSNSRLNELIELAGGVTEQADTNRINLARKITDGEKITIYPLDESIDYFGIDILNFGSKEVLIAVDGIGEVIAERIILHRESEGVFTDFDQLLLIEGIGEQKLEKIKQAIGD